MTFQVEFHTDDAAFPIVLSGVTLTAPDSFTPEVGTRIHADHIPSVKPGERAMVDIGSMNLYVTEVEWRLRLVVTGPISGQPPQYEMVMRVTLSTQAPAPTARVSRKKK